jgi:hypothetical protein
VRVQRQTAKGNASESPDKAQAENSKCQANLLDVLKVLQELSQHARNTVILPTANRDDSESESESEEAGSGGVHEGAHSYPVGLHEQVGEPPLLDPLDQNAATRTHTAPHISARRARGGQPNRASQAAQRGQESHRSMVVARFR